MCLRESGGDHLRFDSRLLHYLCRVQLRSSSKDSRTLQTFAEDVDAMVTDLLTQKSNIIYSTMNSSAPVASLEPVKPAHPHGKNLPLQQPPFINPS